VFSIKQKKTKKQSKTPAYPILKFHVIGNTHIIFFGLTDGDSHIITAVLITIQSASKTILK
jgi:capsule polysaccharide export protein KpsE/RkpR